MSVESRFADFFQTCYFDRLSRFCTNIIIPRTFVNGLQVVLPNYRPGQAADKVSPCQTNGQPLLPTQLRSPARTASTSMLLATLLVLFVKRPYGIFKVTPSPLQKVHPQGSPGWLGICQSQPSDTTIHPTVTLHRGGVMLQGRSRSVAIARLSLLSRREMVRPQCGSIPSGSTPPRRHRLGQHTRRISY